MKTPTPPQQSIQVYGISNCDTVKKACQWLEEHQVGFEFHDLRKDHIDAHTIEGWLDQIEGKRGAK